MVNDLNTPQHWDGIYSNWLNEGTVDLKREQMREAHAAILSIIPRTLGISHFIDIACGPGLLLELMAIERPHYALTGADFSDVAIALAKGNAPLARIDQIDVKEPLPYSNRSFDISFCGHIIEHLEDPIALLREMARITTKRGRIIVNFPHGDQPYEMHLHHGLTNEQVQDWMTSAGITIDGILDVIPGPPVDQGTIYGHPS